MKKHISSFCLLLLLVLWTNAVRAQIHVKSEDQHEAKAHVMINDHNLRWVNAPASLPAGAMIAVLEGDMSQAGPFTVRIKLPKNYSIKPHTHPAIEHVTVIEGSFYMGKGREYNENTATEIKKGGFAVMPAGFEHFAFTRGNTVIQLHGIGPWGITYVNEADDPRNKK